MKQFLAAALIISISSSSAAQTVTLNTTFNIGKIYIEKTKQTTSSVLALSNESTVDPEVAAAFPIETTMLMSTTGHTTISDQLTASGYRVVTEFTDHLTQQTAMGKTTEDKALTGTKVFGWLDNNQYVYESMQASVQLPGFEEAMAAMMLQMFAAKPFSAQGLSVGESLSFEAPLALPIANIAQMSMNLATTMTLDKIDGDLAYYSNELEFSMDVNEDASSTEIMGGSGSGGGTMIYHIEDAYMVSNESTQTITADLEINGIMMTMQLDVHTLMTTEIK